jgi:hypothetical protein
VSGQLLAPATLPPGKSPRYPLDRRLGGPRTGLDAVEKSKVLDHIQVGGMHGACSTRGRW